MKQVYAKISDEILILRCQAGDDQALDTLITRWQPRLFRHAALHLGDTEPVADIVQDSWMAIVRSLHRMHDPALFHAWAYKIVTNKCRDWRRKQQKEKRLFTRESPSQHDVCALPPLGYSSAGHDAEEIERALDRLPQEDKILVNLFYFDDLTVFQIAQIFDIPVGTVKSRLFRCRENLRKILEIQP